MDPTRFENIFIGLNATLRETIERIDAGAVEIALVVEDERRLVGTISDGDVRRALLGGAGLDTTIEGIAHREPVTAPLATSERELLRLMRDHGVEQIPLVEDGRVVDLAFIRDLMRPDPAEHPVVIMAGGQGMRLRPLTEETPKPMLPVGDRPLLETMLQQVSEAGFSKVLMAVNYRGEVIEDHFGDGDRFGVDIRYVHEDRPLGSAGALALVRAELDRPFIVINADLLTNVNLGALLRFHREEESILTVGVRKYALEVPYGVVELDGSHVTGLREKPRIELFVNAGVYAVSPDALGLLPADVSEVNMTDLVDAGLRAGSRVSGFPIREYWLDVGELGDYERAHDDHATYFSVSE